MRRHTIKGVSLVFVIALAIFPAIATATRAATTSPSGDRCREANHVRTLRVFGRDDRTPVTNTTAPPFASMGMITAQFGEGTAYQTRAGTGTLISDRVVLGCAHVVYEPSLGWADHISFYPEDNRQTASIAVAAVPGLVRGAWAGSRDDNNDIALILLDEPVGRDTGVMAVASKPISFFSDPTLNLSGYASDLEWSILYNSIGSAIRVNDNLIVHHIDSGPGQSGGPLWYYEEAKGLHTIVGIATGDTEVTVTGWLKITYGTGVRINPEICAWINDYLAANDPTAATSCDPSTGEDPSPICGWGVDGVLPFGLAALALMGNGRRRCAYGPPWDPE